MNPKRVEQEHNTCAVACIAMVLGISHDEAMDMVRLPFVFDGGTGLTMSCVVTAICSRGWTCHPQNRFDALLYANRPVWPPKPFAPVHVVYASLWDWGKLLDGLPTEKVHAVVLTEDGTVLDPARERQRESLHEFVNVLEVVGFYPPRKWWRFWK